MFQLLISLIGAIVPICVEDRPISATHGAGKEEILPAQEGIH
jgi:hypothetical protein